MINTNSTGKEIRAALAWYFRSKEYYPPYRRLAEALENSTCLAAAEPVYDPDDYEQVFPTGGRYKLSFLVPIEYEPTLRGEQALAEMNSAFEVLADHEHKVPLQVSVKVLPPDEILTTGLNNCFFKQERTILHDELRFRSMGEVAVFDELKQRNVLFFPNPAAVLGTDASEFGERVEKKEPDFLVCFKGKWGILEINGDGFHSGLVKTTKDHERARRFNKYGLFFVQSYDADKCKSDPGGVVDEFLHLLSNHR